MLLFADVMRFSTTNQARLCVTVPFRGAHVVVSVPYDELPFYVPEHTNANEPQDKGTSSCTFIVTALRNKQNAR